MSRPKHVEDSDVTYMLLLNCALKLVEEIILLLLHLVGFYITLPTVSCSAVKV